MPVRRSDGTWVVLVGRLLLQSDRAVARVRGAALWAGPVAVVAATLAAWLVATAALRPVERLRKEVREISEKDEAAALAVPHTRDEISALALTLNDLLLRLHGALARERAFVANAGHELRTPLAILRTELELASRPGRTRDELASALTAAVEETDRLVRLAEDLLLLAHSDEGAGQLRCEPTPIAPLLASAAERAAAAAGPRGISIRVNAAPDIVAEVDPDRLRQAIDNVIDNAIRHTAPATVVDVDACTENGQLVIEVADRGPGFPPSFLPHAFERFRRADGARTRGDGGAGLGLSIVLSIVRAHGGTAAAMNREAGGALVRLALPVRHQ
jgi:signal transduction histidine kinase